MGELPVPGAVADGVDVRAARATMLVGGDSDAPVELHAGSLEADPFHKRPAADRDEHQIRLYGLALPEVDGHLGAVVLDPRGLLAKVQRDAALSELLGQLLARILVLLRDEREHLDDRHLRAEAAEDRGELAADDPATKDNEPVRHPLLGE